MAGVADFVIGSLELRLQFIHCFLTLLELALEKRNKRHLSYGAIKVNVEKKLDQARKKENKSE